MSAGHVSLVGAGPGDPGLLTLKGRAALERADVVLYDQLASPALLAAVPVAGQERIHVGKAHGLRPASQDDINRLIVRRAQAGQRVVRLKGGDPCVLGRGGEEARACVDAGITFEIVPGVTSATAVPAYAGIPVTDRAYASSVTVVTGHERAGAERVNWPALGAGADTVVVLMGVRQAERWSSGLMAGGRPGDTPVAFIRNGTTPAQRTLVTTLARAATDVAAAGLRPPAVAVVGEVVTLRPALSWFEGRPLTGQVIAWTRSDPGDASVFDAVTRAGAALVHVPLTQQVMLDSGRDALAARLAAADASDIVVTSANSVRALNRALHAAGLDARALAGVRTWAVGPQTAAALRAVVGVAADVVPAAATGEALVAEAGARGVSGARFLFPAAREARRAVPDGLAALGAAVDEIACYETQPRPDASVHLINAFEAGLTLVTLASPSAVRALIAALAATGTAPAAVAVAVIGPTTAAAARAAGLDVRVVPTRYTLADLGEAIVAAGRAGALLPPPQDSQ